LLATLRRSALFTTAVIAISGFAFGACSGPAFTNSDANGKGGEEAVGGVTSSGSGGAKSGDGGQDPSAGGIGVITAGGSSSGASGEGGTSGGTRAGGGSPNGGARAGGAGGSSPSGGTLAGGAGGISGLGGIGVGGLVATAGALGVAFPSTSVLDDFARPDGELGDSWLGATDEFSLHDEQLLDTTDAGQPLLWSERFGPNQEVFATLASFAAESREINLVLKAQEVGNPCDLIEVMYEPTHSRIGLDFCVNVNSWTNLKKFDVALSPGDQLGARASANGKVVVYRNGQPIATFDTSGFPYQKDGHIGVNALSVPEDPATWDDFGGGNTAP
jgi:hypothetical protein